MTDTMTDEELNEAIFKARGWQKIDGVAFTTHINKDGRKTRQYAAPDYTHDWRLCGELLEEMKFTAVSLFFNHVIDKWGIGWVDEYNSHHCLYAPTPQRAICEACLARKGAE